MSHLILGIDPGASGAVAELYSDGKTDAFSMLPDDDMRDYFECLRQVTDRTIVAYMELVGGYIGKPQPGSGMFKFGNGNGYIRGLLAANRIKTVMVRPQAWQKGISGVQGVKGPDRKRVLKEAAARLFPALKVTLSTADALLIGAYGWAQERPIK